MRTAPLRHQEPNFTYVRNMIRSRAHNSAQHMFIRTARTDPGILQ